MGAAPHSKPIGPATGQPPYAGSGPSNGGHKTPPVRSTTGTSQDGPAPPTSGTGSAGGRSEVAPYAGSGSAGGGHKTPPSQTSPTGLKLNILGK